MVAVTGGHGWFAVEETQGHIGWIELQGTWLEMGCMRGVKSRVGAKCARKCGVNQGKGVEGDGGETPHDRGGRDDVLQRDVGQNQGNGWGPWAGTSPGDHLHRGGQRWRLLRPSRKQRLEAQHSTGKGEQNVTDYKWKCTTRHCDPSHTAVTNNQLLETQNPHRRANG